MAEPKNYINGILIKEIGEFGNLNISVKVDDFYKALESIRNGDWANIVIAKNRNPTDKGYTHHCYQNMWKPKREITIDHDEQHYNEPTPNGNSQTDDDLPF